MECDPPTLQSYTAEALGVWANLGLLNPFPRTLTMGEVEAHPGWKECARLITPEVSHEAWERAGLLRYRDLLTAKNIEFIEIYSRPKPKDVKRIQDKATSGKFFKANADMCSIRIVASLDSMKSIIRFLRDQANVVERDRTVFNSDTNKLTDIAAFFYAFDKQNYPFVTEIQVVHPFANLAFKRDSHLREFPGDGFDLFEGGFYERVKTDILTRTYDVSRDMKEIFGAVLDDVVAALNM